MMECTHFGASCAMVIVVRIMSAFGIALDVRKVLFGCTTLTVATGVDVNGEVECCEVQYSKDEFEEVSLQVSVVVNGQDE